MKPSEDQLKADLDKYKGAAEEFEQQSLAARKRVRVLEAEVQVRWLALSVGVCVCVCGFEVMKLCAVTGEGEQGLGSEMQVCEVITVNSSSYLSSKS